jgi:hypothetical protein
MLLPFLMSETKYVKTTFQEAWFPVPSAQQTAEIAVRCIMVNLPDSI